MDLTTSLSQKVTLFNLLVNKHIDDKLTTTEIFPVSDELVRISNADVVSSVIDALVKLYSSVVTNYQDLYSTNGHLSYEKYCELAYFLLKLVRYLGQWESHTSYEVQ